MIDFYKHSFLSVLGKNAGTMTDIEYSREIVNKYNKYLKSLKEMKKNIGDNATGSTELYL